MVYTYDMTNVTNATNVLQFFTAVNDITSDWLARLFLIGIGVLIYMSIVINQGTSTQAIVSASFVTTIISLLFYLIDLTGFKEPLASFIVFAISLITLYLGGTNKV